MIAAADLIYISSMRTGGRVYRVEAERVVRQLEADPSLRADPSSVDLSKYSLIKRVSIFDASELINNDYVVEPVDGTLYRIEYVVKDNAFPFIIMNIGFGVFFIVSLAVFIYIGNKVIKPFGRMSSMTVDLAKGNLTQPMKEDKNRFFGKFIWGVDMLRENLEDSRTKNLEYQKEKKTLLLSLSHDIKTPLSAIQLYTKALSEGIYDTDEEKTNAYKGILAKTDEIRSYVDEIHRISREDFMEFDVKNGEFYISEAMSGIEAYYKDKLSVLHTEFEIAHYDDCILSGDKDRFVEAMQNLMENAIKYGDGHKISIGFDEEEDCRLISVTNTGCSLDESELASVFDSFYRGSNTANIQGNGLGLYIVKQLMTRMDGDAFAQINGNNFTVTLVARKA
ncbi:Signal transduction histidine kinase [Ruminococcaceae bacterium YRB3002]|nr:Signal transduction histidine kinase [Ruminococcaceae bacterium YRB3002]